ncbi:hypothetical protein VTN96DRAFT_6523 [Rasamsonia emersonii]
MGDLSTSIKSYFLSSRFSDLTIYTEDQEFKVHRLVVCGRSEYFSRLFNGNWAETAENVVQLKDDDPRAVEAMVHFMYGYEYDSSGSDRGRISPILFNVKVYQLADKYGVPQLKQRAKEKFENIAKTCWQMDDFPTAIAEAYTCTPKEDRGLRDTLVEISCEHIDELQKNDDFQTVLEEAVGFAADLVQYLARWKPPNSNLMKYRCPNCSAQWLLERCTGDVMYHCPFCGNHRSNWNSYVIQK